MHLGSGRGAGRHAHASPPVIGHGEPTLTLTRRGFTATFAISLLGASLIPGLVSSGCTRGESREPPPAGRPLPELPRQDPSSWLNSAPLSRAELFGYVVLVGVWSFASASSTRSLPWLNELEARYASRGLRVLGVHAPGGEDREVLAEKVRQLQLRHPILLDDDGRYGEELGIVSWPSFYLVDRRGEIRDAFAGETRIGDRRAREAERAVAALVTA
jgi:hypothetical protein